MLELSLNKNLNCWQCKLKKTRCKLDAHKVQADRILGQQKMRNVTTFQVFPFFSLFLFVLLNSVMRMTICAIMTKVLHIHVQRDICGKGGRRGVVARCNAEYFPLQDTLLGLRESPACFWARFHLPSWL